MSLVLSHTAKSPVNICSMQEGSSLQGGLHTTHNEAHYSDWAVGDIRATLITLQTKIQAVSGLQK